MEVGIRDERTLTGYADIDQVHEKIVELSQLLGDLLTQKAPFDAIYQAFLRLQEALILHFDIEDRYLRRLPQGDEVRAHVLRHRENHDRFRDLLAYSDEQFGVGRAAQAVPNAAALVAGEYMQELLDVDTEMRTMLQKYGLDDGAKQKNA